MKLKLIIISLFSILLCGVALFYLVQRNFACAAEVGKDKIEGLLIDQFTSDGAADFIVRFTEQADLFSAYSMDWDARGEFVYNTLRETADRSQANAKTILAARGLPYHTFIAGHALYVGAGNQQAENG